MKGFFQLPKDLHKLFFTNYLNVRDAAVLSATCTNFQKIYQSLRDKEDEVALNELLNYIARLDRLRIRKEKKKTKDKDGNVYPFERWALCRKCDTIYATKNIKSHHCKQNLQPCSHCGLYIKHQCPFQTIVCNSFHDEKKCYYKDKTYRIVKHRDKLRRATIDWSCSDSLTMFAVSYNVLRIMSGMSGLAYGK
jgi:hypothetical protein